MTGPVAQIVALTCYGNAFLDGHTEPEFLATNSTCQFCDRVAFVELVKRLLGKKERKVAKSPGEWFPYLQGKDARGIRLVHQAENAARISDRMSAGLVGGGGTWSMEVLLPKDRSESWQARWQVWNQKDPDRRIWRVIYGRAAVAASKPYARQNLEATALRLLEALREIHGFSERHSCGAFTNAFEQAISSLTSPQRHGYHKDLSPPGLLPNRAEAVLDAAQSAWVFGGMGSWNDLGFEGENVKEYERVSDQLFRKLTEAICVATNEGFKKVEPALPGNESRRANR